MVALSWWLLAAIAALLAGPPDLSDLANVPVRNPGPKYALELLRELGREPAEESLAEHIARHLRWARPRDNERSFPEIVALLRTPEFLDETDGIFREAVGRKATAFELIQHASDYLPTVDRSYWVWWYRRAANRPLATWIGECVDEKGLPLAGVFVSTPEAETETGSDGRFKLKAPYAMPFQRPHHMSPGSVLRWQPEGTIQLYVQKDGRVPQRHWSSHGPLPERFRFEMPPAREATVKVEDAAGQLVPFAAVKYTAMFGPKNSQTHSWFAHADRTGVAVLEGIPVGGKLGFTSGWHSRHGYEYIEDFAADAAPTIKFSETKRFAGRVVDSSGAPVWGAMVCGGQFKEGAPNDVEWYAPAAITGADGAFGLAISERLFKEADRGQPCLVVRRNGFLQAVEIFDAKDAEARTGLVVKLKEGAWVEGTVVGAEGTPVADCLVGFPSRPGHGQKDDRAPAGRPGFDLGIPKWLAATDAKGKFRIGPFPKREEVALTAIQDYPVHSEASARGVAGGEPIEIRLPAK